MAARAAARPPPRSAHSERPSGRGAPRRPALHVAPAAHRRSGALRPEGRQVGREGCAQGERPPVRWVRERHAHGVERVSQNKCCSLESVDDARRVARMLDIPFYLVNVEQEFKENVVDLFYQEYVAGRTPNPCLNCNRHIRFTLLLNRALALDADYLATGHYVRVDDHPITGKRRLRRGIDPEKDQSYVLHVLNQQQLAHACFPLGEYTKPQVRAMAAQRGMSVASKAESQEICFVAQNDYRGFIDRYARNQEEVQEPQLVGVGARATTAQASGVIQIPRPGPIFDFRFSPFAFTFGANERWQPRTLVASGHWADPQCHCPHSGLAGASGAEVSGKEVE